MNHEETIKSKIQACKCKISFIEHTLHLAIPKHKITELINERDFYQNEIEFLEGKLSKIK